MHKRKYSAEILINTEEIIIGKRIIQKTRQNSQVQNMQYVAYGHKSKALKMALKTGI